MTSGFGRRLVLRLLVLVVVVVVVDSWASPRCGFDDDEDNDDEHGLRGLP